VNQAHYGNRLFEQSMKMCCSDAPQDALETVSQDVREAVRLLHVVVTRPWKLLSLTGVPYGAMTKRASHAIQALEIPALLEVNQLLHLIATKYVQILSVVCALILLD